MHDFIARFGVILLDTLVPIGIGFILHKADLISKRGVDLVIKFNVRAMFTILSVLTFWKLKISAELLMLPVGAIVMTLVPFWVMSYLTRKNPDPLERGALVTAGMLGNIGTLGGVISFLILGPLGFSYVQILATIANVILILFNFPLCQKYREAAEAIPGTCCKNRRVPHQEQNFFSLFFTWNQVALLGMILVVVLSVNEVRQPE